MVMRTLLAPRRLPAAPAAAGPVPGFMLSLSLHAAVVAGVVGGGAAAAGAGAPASDPADAGGKRLHWVGVGSGAGDVPAPRAGRPGLRPPIAYVVPGRDGARGPASADGRGPGTRPPGRDASPRDGTARRADGAEPERLTLRLAPRPARLPLAPLPGVALPVAEVTRLVAGVLAAAPDLARRVSRPEDFVPVATELSATALLARLGVRALGVVAVDPHASALPIPFVDNPTPVYPTALARAGVGGRVVVEFRVDSMGTVAEGSLRVVESTGAPFADAVRQVMPRLRFLPGQLGEQPVGVTVRQPFLFTVRPGY